MFSSIVTFFSDDSKPEVKKHINKKPQAKRETNRNPRNAKGNTNRNRDSSDKTTDEIITNTERRPNNRKTASRKPTAQTKKYDNDAKPAQENNNKTNNEEVIVARRKRRNMRKKVRVQQPENVVENANIENSSTNNSTQTHPKNEVEMNKVEVKKAEVDVTQANVIATDVSNDSTNKNSNQQDNTEQANSNTNRRSRYLRNNGQRNKNREETNTVETDAVVSRYPEENAEQQNDKAISDKATTKKVKNEVQPSVTKVDASVTIASTISEISDLKTPQEEAENLTKLSDNSNIQTAEKILPVDTAVETSITQAPTDKQPEVVAESKLVQLDAVEVVSEEKAIKSTPTKKIKKVDVDTSSTIKVTPKQYGTVSVAKGKSTSVMVKTISEPLDLTKQISIVAATERQSITKASQPAGSSFASNHAKSDMVKTSL
jgi:ribonuclease E